MNRIEHNIQTGEIKIIELSPAEIGDAIAYGIAQDAANLEFQQSQLPPLQDQIDALFIGGKTAEDMKAKINAIKGKLKP